MEAGERREVGRRLKEARNGIGMTQKQVAERLGIRRQQVSKMETGVALPNCEQWYVLGRLYVSSLDYLVYGIEMIPKQLHTIMAQQRAAQVERRAPEASDTHERLQAS